MTRFKKVSFKIEYIVPENEVNRGIDAVETDILSIVKADEIIEWVTVSPAPDAGWDDVPSWLIEDMEEE